MTKYHPDTRFITDYAAGSLAVSQALCVSTHLHYCSDCQAKVEQLTALGNTFFTELAPAKLEHDFEALMSRIDSMPDENISLNSQASAKTNLKLSSKSSLPAVLHKLIQGDLKSLSWRYIGKNFRYSDLNVGDPDRETSLFNIKAGGNVPRHRHGGDEITVVLKGSFSDQDDNYQVGDFIVRTPGETHSPVASQDEDCLCLSTLDAPIEMTNWFYRLLAPLIQAKTQTS